MKSTENSDKPSKIIMTALNDIFHETNSFLFFMSGTADMLPTGMPRLNDVYVFSNLVLRDDLNKE